MFQVSPGKAVLGNFADAAVLHVGAKQLGQYHADLTLAFAAPALDDHHPLALVAGNEAVPDKLLNCGDIFRVEKVGQEPQPVSGLGRCGVIFDRQPVADHFRLAFLKAAIQIQGAVGQMDTVGDWREVIHLGGEFQQVQNAAHLAGHVVAGIVPQLSIDGTPQRHLVCYPAIVTDGKISLRGNLAVREKGKRADYLLYLSPNNPIAVIEAKDNNHQISEGLQQAMNYAKMLDLPFAFSSNGDGFAEHDFLTGAERQFGLDEFPTEVELTERFKKESGLTPLQETAMNQPYYSSQNTYPPRYYQRIAINRTVDAIARGQKRLLLVMATGTGKTYTAFQIVYRLLKSETVHKVLYLADRNMLVDQSIEQDFAPLQKTIHKINVKNDNPNTITSYEVYFSLYQQLVGDDDKEHFRELFQPDFFDLIIVDECHRGSAKEESRWRRVLEYFSDAIQIGMTATPKETKYISNLSYFGEPVYTYSLKEGIDDGFLAPFKVINITTNIGEGWRPQKGQLDIYGNEIPDRIYTNSDYDYSIIIEDRIREVAQEITRYLKSTDRMARTIVFCATEDAALRMRDMLAQLNQDMVKKNPDYVVRITGSDEIGKGKIKQFSSVTQKYPVIATTSKLLSTGADCKMTKLIVLDEMIGFCLVQFQGTNDNEMPRMYLATPAEIAEKMNSSAGGRGGTILYENHTWGPRAVASGTIDKVPDTWKFTRQRATDMIENYGK